MNKVNSYGAYQSSFYDSAVKNKKEQEKTKAAEKQEEIRKTKQPELSSRAKKLLKELQKKYGNMDFMVGSYDTDEEAAAYLSRGTKEYSVLIDPEELEKMASDEETKKKYLGMLEEATGKLDQMKNQLGEHKDEVTHMGVSIGKDGTMSFFADLEKVSEKQRERIEKKREEKADSVKRTRVKAASTQELLKKIKQVDWSKIKEERVQENGRRFDYSI